MTHWLTLPDPVFQESGSGVTRINHTPPLLPFSRVAFIFFRGWLGRAMVLGSFQCRCDLLLWHIVEQGPSVLAAGAGWVGCCFSVCFFHLISTDISFPTANDSEILLFNISACKVRPQKKCLVSGNLERFSWVSRSDFFFDIIYSSSRRYLPERE